MPQKNLKNSVKKRQRDNWRTLEYEDWRERKLTPIEREYVVGQLTSLMPIIGCDPSNKAWMTKAERDVIEHLGAKNDFWLALWDDPKPESYLKARSFKARVSSAALKTYFVLTKEEREANKSDLDEDERSVGTSSNKKKRGSPLRFEDIYSSPEEELESKLSGSPRKRQKLTHQPASFQLNEVPLGRQAQRAHSPRGLTIPKDQKSPGTKNSQGTTVPGN